MAEWRSTDVDRHGIRHSRGAALRPCSAVASDAESAGIPYRIVGGLAVFIHVSERDPIRAHLTSDVDAAIRREDLPSVIAAAGEAGWRYRQVAGVDMLVDAERPKTRSAAHLVFLNEKVLPDYLEAVPDSPPDTTREGVLLAPVADLFA